MKQPRKQGRRCQPEGVAIFAPRGMRRYSRAVYTPMQGDIRSRAIAVHFRSGEYDLCIVSLYCPICKKGGNNRNVTERLWDWVRGVRVQVGRSTTMIICTDAIGHVGSVRRRTSYRKTEEIHDQEEYMPVGPEGASAYQVWESITGNENKKIV